MREVLEIVGLIIGIELIFFIALKSWVTLNSYLMLHSPEKIHFQAMKSLKSLTEPDIGTGQFMPEEDSGISVDERLWAYQEGAGDDKEAEKMVLGKKRNLDE